MSIRLDAFDYDLIEQYYLKNLLESQFWLFGSSANEQQKPFSQNTNRDAIDFLERTIFGVRYQPSDFAFMLPIISWQQDFVFTQYDDRKIIKNQPFYVVVEPEIESGNYHIFKCISNNNGSHSKEKPEFNPSIQDGIYPLSDGYIWKFMTSTPFTLFRKFAARGLIPIIRNQQVENIAVDGIFNMVVENRNENNGYERITGNISSISIENGITRVFLKNLFSETNSEIPVFEVPNTYSDKVLYVKKSNLSSGIGAIEVRIRTSGIINNVPFVTVTTPSNFSLETDDTIEILPRVEIEGNGTGASAITIFNEDNRRINSISMLQLGSGYTNAIARIVDPVSFDPNNVNRDDIRCIVRPIISPKGGHGANPLFELRTKHIGLSVTITSIGTSNIPFTGSYSKIGVVKEPEFSQSFSDTTFDNRIKIELDILPGNLQVGDQVSQGVVTATVHEINSQTNTIFVVDYEGPYSEVFTENLPLQFESSNFDINSIEYSTYNSKTGQVLTIADVTPIERDGERSEQIRLILDF